MANTVLHDDGNHRNILLEDFGTGDAAVQANQHLIIHGNAGMILDPGGHKVYSKVLSETTTQLGSAKLQYVFLSHQDPDIVAACNGWLMATEATAYVSTLWTRFVPHFGLDHLVTERLLPIEDEGMVFNLGGADILALPAHFLHSCGNFHLYDTVSKILYTGDLGASVDPGYIEVSNFEEHAEKMLGFHQRYMGSGAALKAWAKMVSSLDIETIAPQHGALFKGKDMVSKFIEWCSNLECGSDIMADCYKVPQPVGT